MLTTTYQLSPTLPTITLVARDGKLIALDWYTHKTAKLLDKLTQQAEYIAQQPDDLDQKNQRYQQNCDVLFTTKQQLDEYLKGQRQHFDVPLDFSYGTPFQQRVWQQLLAIPYGQTISYAELAKRIDQPTAYRAVANANGKNPISLIIPCHRVIASDGGLGGYTGGLDIKRQLLAIEKSGN